MLQKMDFFWSKLQSTRLWVVILLIVHAEMLIWSSVVNAPTVDEPRHVVAGLHHWKTLEFVTNPGNTPFVNMISTLPLVCGGGLNHETRGEDFVNVHGPQAFWYIIYCRWASIPFSLLGGYVCFIWARALNGNGAGLLALILWCFSPDILANGQLLTCDVAATSVGVAACFVYWQWLRHRTWEWALGAGLLLGIVQLTKYVWVVAYPLWLAIWCIKTCVESRQTTRSSLFRELAQMATIMFLSLYIINLAYGFEGTFSKLGSYPQIGRLLENLGLGRSDAREASHNFLTQSVQSLPLPLPRQYVVGVSAVTSFNLVLTQHHRYGVYLNGERKIGGWWYFYLFAMAMKFPIGFWILIGLACLLPAARSKYSGGWLDDFTLLALVAGIVAFVSFVTSAQHIRYVLPAYPFLFIWVSKLAITGLRPLLNTTVTFSVLSFVISSIGVFPHSLSYFNELAGGARHGHRHLVDASFDWGQDLFYLRDWLRHHAGTRPVRVAYNGLVDPRSVGINASFTSEPAVGLNVISATVLRSGYEGWSEGFLKYEPIATAGYSIYIYEIDAATVQEIRQRAETSKLYGDN